MDMDKTVHAWCYKHFTEQQKQTQSGDFATAGGPCTLVGPVWKSPYKSPQETEEQQMTISQRPNADANLNWSWDLGYLNRD